MDKTPLQTVRILADPFVGEGRGPELHKVVWSEDGRTLVGFEYVNDVDSAIRHIKLQGVQAFAMASEEVHSRTLAFQVQNMAFGLYEIVDSAWKTEFRQWHLDDTTHYMIMFYDEVFDVLCKNIAPGEGRLEQS